MRFSTRDLTDQDAKAISGWRYAAPYDIYDESSWGGLDAHCRAIVAADGALAGYFCWDREARVPVAEDVYAAAPDALDVGLGLAPAWTGRGQGMFAVGCALDWLRTAYAPPAFRLAVYEWNARARRVYERLDFVTETKRGEFLLMVRDETPWQDASRALVNGVKVYPTDPPFDRRLFYTKEQSGGWDVSVLSMGAHCGTHIDAPAHIGLDGGVETIPLAHLNGAVQVLDWAAQGIAAVRGPRVLLQMDGRFLDMPQAQALVDAGVVLVGVDGLSVGEGELEYPVHALLLKAGATILENAALEAFAPGWYTMRCLPLSLPGSDGAPVRLFLRSQMLRKEEK